MIVMRCDAMREALYPLNKNEMFDCTVLYCTVQPPRFLALSWALSERHGFFFTPSRSTVLLSPALTISFLLLVAACPSGPYHASPNKHTNIRTIQRLSQASSSTRSPLRIFSRKQDYVRVGKVGDPTAVTSCCRLTASALFQVQQMLR